MTKRALITGVNGQDGSYLTELLLAKDYEVFGLDKAPQPPDLALTCPLTRMYVVDLMMPERLGEVIREVRPDEVYHLAAHHFSSQTSENRTGELEPFLRVNLIAANSALEAIATTLPTTRFFYPASAQIFGNPDECPQTESTPHNPVSPYAISKSAGVYLCRYFRQAHGVFAAAGILYNHESPRRGPSFITSQIARAAALASLGRPEPLVVRDLDALVDWGAAQDYVRAMWLMLQQDTSEEYVVASGSARTVREFAREAFSVVGLDATDFVSQESPRGGPRAIPYIGDSTKIRMRSGWEPAVTFVELVRTIVEAQVAMLTEAIAR